MKQDLSRQSLQKLDANDPLAAFSDQFLIPEGLLYMNGNSLGPLTRGAKDKMTAAVSEEWGNQLIRGWNSAGWYDMPGRIGDKIGTLVGADTGEVAVCDSTSVNLFKAVSAAISLNPGRTKILSEAGNFPTDLYILDGVKQFAKGDYVVDIQPRDQVLNAIDQDTAVVVLTHVHYVSGAVFPMQEITAKAHEMGALVVWDLSHSVGAIATDLNGANADFAVGCGYKHLNGGPGAPAFIFAAKRHHEKMRQPLSGWFSHKTPFTFTDDYAPADGIQRMLTGTTSVLGASALEASVDLMLQTNSAERLYKMVQLSTLLEALIDHHCSGFDLTLVSPKDPKNRGAHLSYRHPSGHAIMQNLIDRGVIGDFRAPDYIRLGISPMFMGYEELLDAVLILKDILTTKSYEGEKYQIVQAVT